MRHLLRLALILLLVVTGIALGHVRGQSRIAGQVVLCAGGAVATVSVDSDGRPVPVTHICPDMALSLLAGLSPEALLPSPERLARPAGPLAAAPAARGTQVVPAQARGPPFAA